jgi:two-component system, OmpR family, sensor histidine kinase KdpD
MSSDKRIDADQLLRSVQKEEQRRHRGLLRIFFGMCPGVGKTYAMLHAAKEKEKSGTDVVVGLVETHGREETQHALNGLEILPRRTLQYKGKEFSELDVEGILRRAPQLVLIDELAHTNIPGSRHAKRIQDVKEVLEAGIDVYTTMNVQHLESRVDLVKQITGITVHETVPDSFFELADQVEVIDLPPAELLKRLKAGKVYLGDMAARAVEGFFQEEHLIALRELALRFTAELVEGELQDQMLKKQISGPWPTHEKLMVAISHSPYSKRLIRAARRKAFNLEANWIALYIDTGESLSETDRATLKKNIDLARELGAELVSVRDTDVPSAIRRIAEEKNVTQIVMGRPDRRFFRDLFSGGTILDKLVRETSEIDVHVLRQVRKPRIKGFRFSLRMPRPYADLTAYSNTFWFVSLVSTLGYGLEPLIQYQAVGFLLLLSVIGIASIASRGPSLFAAFLSAMIWNYFFIPPKFTFYIKEFADVMMHIAYFAVALAASYLTSKIRRQADELKKRAKQTGLLYDLSSELAAATQKEAIGTVANHFVERTLGGVCRILIAAAEGVLEECGQSEGLFQITEKHLAVAAWVLKNGSPAGVGTDTLAGSDVFCMPVRASKRAIGVLVYAPPERKGISFEDESILQSVCASVAISLERDTLQKDRESLRVTEESEKLYQTILDAVSHELRTPITSIMGAATALQDPRTAENVGSRIPLTEEIVRGSQRLNQVVENLLDTSRMSTGRLDLKKELVEVSETVESIVQAWAARESTSMRIQFQGEDAYAAVDARMLQNALENLCFNAQKYSFGKTLRVQVSRADAECVAIDVMDEGPGVPDSALPTLFDRFYRIPGTPSGGTGLGLSIVKGVVEAHGGRIEVKNRKDTSGLHFRMTFPQWKEGMPPHAHYL